MATHTGGLLGAVCPTYLHCRREVNSSNNRCMEQVLKNGAYWNHVLARAESLKAAAFPGGQLLKPLLGRLSLTEGDIGSRHGLGHVGQNSEKTEVERGLISVLASRSTRGRLGRPEPLRAHGTAERLGRTAESDAHGQAAVRVAETAELQFHGTGSKDVSQGSGEAPLQVGQVRRESAGAGDGRSLLPSKSGLSRGSRSAEGLQSKKRERLGPPCGDNPGSRVQDSNCFSSSRDENSANSQAGRQGDLTKDRRSMDRWKPGSDTRDSIRRRAPSKADLAQLSRSQLSRNRQLWRATDASQASDSSEDAKVSGVRSGSDLGVQDQDTERRPREEVRDPGWDRREGGGQQGRHGRWRAPRVSSGNEGEDSSEGGQRKRKLGRAISHLRGLPPGASVREVMEEHYGHLGRDELATIIAKQQDWRRALDVFEWMDASGRVEGDMTVYAGLTRVLGDAAQWAAIDSLLNKLEASEEPPDGSVYETVMHALGRAKLADKVVDAFDRMVHAGVLPGPKAYNLVMVALQKAQEPCRLIPQAERILVQMNTQNMRYVLPYNCMLNIYVKAGQHKKALRLLRDMEELGLEMDIYTFNAALTAFSQAGNVDAAADLMKWLASHKDYAPTVYTYTIMVGIYGKAQRLGEAVELLEDMRARGLQADAALYNSLLSYLGSAGLVNDVAEVYQQLKTTGPAPDSQTYAMVVAAYGQAQRLTSVSLVLEDVSKAGCQPLEVVWDAVVKACGRCVQQGEVVDAILQQIRAQGWCPTGPHVRALMAEYRKEQPLPHEILRACQEVHEGGARLDEFTWRSLVAFHFYRGHLEEMLAALEGMKADGHTPKQGTLCMVLDLQGTKGNVAQAQAIFRAMKADLQHLDLVSCNTMMNAYALAGLPQEALELLGSMRAEGLAPDTRTWTLVIKAHGTAGQAGGALAAYWSMLEADCPLDEIAYNTVINVCGRELPLEGTLQCYRSMLEAGYRPNSMTCNLVLSLLAKSDRLSEAEDMFKKLKRSGKADAVSFCTMADAYGKRRHLDRMEEVVAEARESGVALQASTYNAMIDAYGKAGMYNDMETTLHHMRAAGLRPNHVTFNSMIHAYGAGSMAVEMEGVLQRQKAAGVERDTWTYNILIGAYGDLEMPYASVKVFRDMQDAGLAPDEVTYLNLTKAFRRAGDYLEAARWSLWMKQAGFQGRPEGDSPATWFPLPAPEQGRQVP